MVAPATLWKYRGDHDQEHHRFRTGAQFRKLNNRSRRMSWSERIRSLWNLENIKIVRRIIVSVVGATVLLIGIALLVLPGPAFIVIPIGLAILATEYAWARHWLRKVRQVASRVIPGRGPDKSESPNAECSSQRGE